MPSFEEKIAEIKRPNLQSQKHTVVVLSSIEDTLTEQSTKATPTAYFAALLCLLKQLLPATEVAEPSDIIISTVYLLDVVTSHVPAALLRTQFTSITTPLAHYASPNTESAPLLRSSIGVLESILVAQDGAAWALPASQMSARRALQALLQLTVDSRPKIRKRAQDAIKNILQNPPPGPSLDHPAAEMCANAAQNALKDAVSVVQQNRKQRKSAEEGNDPATIHALQLTKTIAVASGGWPSKRIEALCEILLVISRSRNDFLVMSAFGVFEIIFESMQDEVSVAKLPRLLKALIELKPAQNDAQLLPPWIAIVSRGYGAYAAVEPEEVFTELPALMDIMTEFLSNASHNIRVSASECLISFFANCVPDSAINEPSIYDEKTLQTIANKTLELLSVKYQAAWMEVFNVLSALFDSFRWRGHPYLRPIVQAIGELRGNSGFQGKSQADEVLGHAIRNLGPRAVLDVLPLNLIAPQKGQSGRAWLLPLLRDHVTNTGLQHFKNELIPLSENMYQRVIDHGQAENTADIKVFETVVSQIWSCLPGYCDLPLDLQSAVDQRFAELLANVLYQQHELRANVCRALQALVESNQAILSSEVDAATLQIEARITKDDASKNLAHLASLAANILAVLFNVYSQTMPQSRAYILQCINAYLSITPEKDLVDTFERVATMLEAELPKPDTPSTARDDSQDLKSKLPPTSHTLLDLIIALSVHLPRQTYAALFQLSSSILRNQAILKNDPQLIKKAYKLIPRLATSNTGLQALKARSPELQGLILSTSETTPIPARRDRILTIQTLITTLPASDLHFVPAILSELVLACKDTNEKARTAGFAALFAAANAITNAPAGSLIRNREVPHMPDDSPDVPATTQEFFSMVSAGLAGVAPNMISATVTALGALLYDLRARSESEGGLPVSLKLDLVETVTMFLQSNNREIVRAVIGFIKVLVVILPLEQLEPRMAKIVPELLVWSKENKGRLRAKVKNILDRLVRRFGGVQVEAWAGPDAKKLVTNIRKARERSKRKKSGTGEADSEDDEIDKGQRTYDNELDDVLASDDDDSEILGSDQDDQDDAMSGVTFKTSASKKSANTNSRKTKGGKEQYIRQDDEDDEPLDLLDPAAISKISSSKRLKDRTNGAPPRKNRAQYNEDGKLIFNDHDHPSRNGRDDDDKDDDTMQNSGGAIDAYTEAVSGTHAVQRGQKGRLKVKSGMQKSSRSEQQAADGLKRQRASHTRDPDGMELDVEEAREVARKIMAGKDSPRSPRPADGRNATGNVRRGLDGNKVQHNRGGGGGIDKRRNKPKPGQRGVRFSSHPARRGGKRS